MTGIYKITNIKTNQCYVGQAEDIHRRWNQHKSPSEWSRQEKNPLYIDMKEYGLQNFNFEVLEECSSNQLAERERYWVQYFDCYHNGYNRTPGGQTNYGDNHPNHKLEQQDIIDIRTRYNNRERKKEVYLDYKDRIGESGFSKIWKGETWRGIMMEVYTLENRTWHSHNTGNKGSSNGRARLNEQDVYNIRLRRKNGENIRVVYQDYQDKITYGSFTNVWTYQNWKNIVV